MRAHLDPTRPPQPHDLPEVQVTLLEQAPAAQTHAHALKMRECYIAMSKEHYADDCPGCRPILIDRHTLATCLNNRAPAVLAVMHRITMKLQAALHGKAN